MVRRPVPTTVLTVVFSGYNFEAYHHGVVSMFKHMAMLRELSRIAIEAGNDPYCFIRFDSNSVLMSLLIRSREFSSIRPTSEHSKRD